MIFFVLAFIGCVQLASAHASIWHPSMWGFNVTNPDSAFNYDNRPVAPLQAYTFEKWWFHGHLGFPPHPQDFLELPAGQTVTTEVACDKGATSYFASSPGGNIQQGDNPCPGSPISEFHTTGLSDVKGCSLAIAYKSNVSEVQPEDFAVFSVNQTCVWNRFTDFQVPAAMPACPPGGCICAWFWIHSEDSGGEQNYMNGFQCNITGAQSNVAIAKPQLPRRCGADPKNNKPQASPGNCTYGAKQPFYWFQLEQNNMFEGQYAPPFYNDLYNFKDGAQNDIFENSYPNGLPTPSPNNTLIPTPVVFGASAPISTAEPTPSSPISSTGATSSSVSPSSSAISSSVFSSPSPSSNSQASSSIPPTSSPSALSSSPVQSNPSSTRSTSATPFPSVSIVVSTQVIVSTLVVTVTASVPASIPTPPPSAASSTVTLYSLAFTTVTTSPPGALPSPLSDPISSASLAASASSDPGVRAAGSSTPTFSATTIDLDPSAATTTTIPVAQNNSSPQRPAAEDFAINEAVVTSFANATASNPMNTSTSSSMQTCKRQVDLTTTNLSKRSFLGNIPGLNRHRKWKRQPTFWQMLSPIPF